MFRRSLVLLLTLISTFAVAATKPNIVLITIASSRTGKPTPTIATLARDGLVFDRAFAQTPETISSHATILSGTYPQTHRAGVLGGPLAPSLPFIPDILRLRGYRAAAFVGTIQLDPKNGPAQGFSRGFAAYDAGFHQPARGETRFTSTERRGMEVVTRAGSWIVQNAKSPLFVWLQLNDASAASGAAYVSAVNAADAAVGKLIAIFRAQELYDDALIVITADHGQSLGAHGEESHGIFLYDETIQVPLLLKLPQKQSAGKRVQGRVSLVDIAPTILAVAGVSIPSQMQGQSLLRSAKTETDRPVYSRSDLPLWGFGWSALESWRAGKYLYIRAPKPELYDLYADPGAKKNLAETSKATVETMAAQLRAFDDRFSGQGQKSSELTSSEMQKLASLGYVGLQKSASGGGAAVSGVDPKDGIDTANKVLAALRFLSDGKPDRTMAALQPSVSALSNIYLAQYAMGAALSQQQQYGSAVEHLHKAIELQPESAWAHYQMGLCLLKTADYKTAAVHLEIATTRLPDYADAHALLAQAYDHLGRAEEAKRERSKALPAGKQ
jgi:choline-sulfatase